MKRSIWGLLILAMALILVSCGGGEEPAATTKSQSEATTVAEETTEAEATTVEETTEEITEAPEETTEATEEPTESEEATTEPTETDDPALSADPTEDETEVTEDVEEPVEEVALISYITLGDGTSDLPEFDADAMDEAQLQFAEANLDATKLEDTDVADVIDEETDVILLDAKDEEDLEPVLEFFSDVQKPILITSQRSHFSDEEIEAIGDPSNIVLVSYDADLEEEAADSLRQELILILAAMAESDELEDWISPSSHMPDEGIPFFIRLADEADDEADPEVTEEPEDSTEVTEEPEESEEVTEESEEETEEPEETTTEETTVEETTTEATTVEETTTEETTEKPEETTTVEATTEETTVEETEETTIEETTTEETTADEPEEDLITVSFVVVGDEESDLPEFDTEAVEEVGVEFVESFLNIEDLEEVELENIVDEDAKVILVDAKSEEELDVIVEFFAEQDLPIAIATQRIDITEEELTAVETSEKMILISYEADLEDEEAEEFANELLALLVAMSESDDPEDWLAETKFVFDEDTPVLISYPVEDDSEAGEDETEDVEEDVEEETELTTTADEEEAEEGDDPALVAPIEDEEDVDDESEPTPTTTDEEEDVEEDLEEETEAVDEEPAEEFVKVSIMSILADDPIPEEIFEVVEEKGLKFVDSYLNPDELEDAVIEDTIEEDTQVIFLDARDREDLEEIVEFLSDADLPLLVATMRSDFTDEEVKAFEEHGKAGLVPYPSTSNSEEFEAMMEDVFVIMLAMNESDDLEVWVAETDFEIDEDIPILLVYPEGEDQSPTDESDEDTVIDEEEVEATTTADEEGDDPALVAPIDDEEVEEDVDADAEATPTTEEEEGVDEDLEEDAEAVEEEVDEETDEVDTEPVEDVEEFPVVALLVLEEESIFTAPMEDTELKLNVVVTDLDLEENEDVELKDLVAEETQAILIDTADQDLVEVIGLVSEVDAPVVIATQRTDFTDDEIAAMEDVSGLLIVVYPSDLEDDEAEAFMMKVYEVLEAAIENGTDEVESWLVESDSDFVLAEEYDFIAYANEDLIDAEADESVEVDETEETDEPEETDEK